MALQRYEEKTEYPYFSEEIFSSPCVLSHPSRKLFLPLHHKITRRRTLGDRMERGKSFCEQPPKNLRRISEEFPKCLTIDYQPLTKLHFSKTFATQTKLFCIFVILFHPLKTLFPVGRKVRFLRCCRDGYC